MQSGLDVIGVVRQTTPDITDQTSARPGRRLEPWADFPGFGGHRQRHAIHMPLDGICNAIRTNLLEIQARHTHGHTEPSSRI